MKSFRHLKKVTLALSMACAAFAHAQVDSMWQLSPFVGKPTNPALSTVRKMATFFVDANELKSQLATAPHESEAINGHALILELPRPDGTVRSYKIWRYDMMSPQLAASTGFKTYRGVGIDDPNDEIRLDETVLGFRGMVLGENGNFFIEPITFGNQWEFASYWKGDNYADRGHNPCFVDDRTNDEGDGDGSNSGGGGGPDGPGDTLKTTRLALNGTIEYTAFYGGVTQANAGATTTMNRVNGVYERDVAIRMNIVYMNNYTGTDPFTNNNGATMLGQNQTACDTNVGNANYDIGHVFSTGGGGIAGLGVVGVTGNKARGVTGSGAPIGDAFDIDYVAHEMGHQYGGNHTFNGTQSSCGGGNRSASHAYEPGSGTTIQAYAGICGTENVQSNSDAHFHYESIREIYNWRNSGTGVATGTNTATGNQTPTVEAGINYTIPQGTAYKLTAVGSDPDNNPLTYCWEQFDLGSATSLPTDYSTGPLVRSRTPISSPVRYIPQVTTSFSNPTGDNWEKLANTNRNMTWRCTVRDKVIGGGTGGYATDTMTLTMSGAPFTVTAPAAAASINGGSNTTVTWTVGGGSVAANVRILFVTSAANYQAGTVTVLSASTPNDGSESVTIPNVATSTGRIVVEAVGNIFYDVNPGNFTVTMVNNPAPVLLSISPNSANAGGPQFTITANGGNFVASSEVRWNGSPLTTTFVNAGQLTATVPAGLIATAGTASVTVFTPAPGGGTSGARTFTINAPAPTTVNPSAFTVVSGALFGGTLASFTAVDGNSVFILNDEADPNAEMQIVGTSPVQTPSAITLTTVASAVRNDLTQFIDAFNYTSNAWVNLDARLSTLSNTTVVENYATPAQFVQAGTREMKSRIRYIPTADLEAADGWSEAVDRMNWSVTP